MHSHVISPGLDSTEIALCGGIAGLATRFAIAPFDVVKIRLQLQSQPRILTGAGVLQPTAKYTGISHAVKVIALEEGLSGFFKGNVAAEYLYLTYGVAQFYSYYHIDRILDNERFQLVSPARAFVSGMVAGSVATTLTYPFDLLRTRFAMQGTRTVYNSLSHAVNDIYQREGVGGFYRGLLPSVTQIMPYMGLMFGTYETLCSSVTWLRSRGVLQDTHKRVDDMVCGSVAAIISKTGVFPLDVVRKRLQVQGPHRTDYVVSSIPHYARRSSVLSCMKSIIRTEGFLALYKGIVPGLLKAGPAGAVNFLVFEFAKDTLVRLKESGSVDELLLPDTTTLTV